MVRINKFDINKLVFVFIFMISVVCISSCSKDSSPLIINELDGEYQLYDYYIDSAGNEGIVAFISSGYYPHRYKSISVISLDESLKSWGPVNEKIIMRDSLTKTILREPSMGIAVLQTMYSKGIEKYSAQEWCFQKNKDCNIYAGAWRLPTYYELYNIFGSSGQNINALNRAIIRSNGTPIDISHFYWTCIEDYNNFMNYGKENDDYNQADRAIVTNPSMTSYTNKNMWNKDKKYYVRAIKYIYYYE